ncbi:MAG: hypothetical protein ACWIPH_04765 [Ostreibacterium sp.]
MGQLFTVNSESSLTAYQKWCAEQYENNHYLTFPAPRIGADRSLDQNALFHVWCGEVAAHFLGISRRLVDRGAIDGVKRTIKKSFYQVHPETYEWMIYTVRCPIAGAEKKDFTSSSRWKTGEMFMVLEWMQFWAADIEIDSRPVPLILESKGEFAKKQREQK